MGISGLLPLLKSIQVNKHLRDLAGQTIAIDAYVWLHRGIMSCAVELATGKPTTRYVDYAMHRVRMLRHYDIKPYVVFDGGPLPAKLGTENHRQKDRDEARARGDAATAQGKHQEARDHYLKSVDVTPQMAFQLIKALRAESVPYVVAPYEADAQLAFLESKGIVDGILTEDSDLLVFGCKNVYFKFDSSTCTLDAISRADFAALKSSSSGITLHGWSDTQFRAMAILSGCDYLPSIPGVGVKTAYTLLRTYKTPNNVVRALRLEGKKPVPRGYEALFKRAEMVFQHQRVYDPESEKLVHLRERKAGDEAEWSDDIEAYVGADIEAGLAKKLAMGDVDPCTMEPMVDINPGYKPRPFKSAAKYAPKTAIPQKAASTGILGYFAPRPKVAPASSSAPLPSSKPASVVKAITAAMVASKAKLPAAKSAIVAGRASGKRTLVEVIEAEIDTAAAKRRKTETPPPVALATTSKFFSGEKSQQPVAGPSRNTLDDKENLPLVIDVDELDIEEHVKTSDRVTQEDGYMSPSEKWDEGEGMLSSPTQSVRFPSPGLEMVTPATPTRARIKVEDFLDAEPVSSPLSKQFAYVAPTRKRPATLPREPSTSGPSQSSSASSSFLSLPSPKSSQGKVLAAESPPIPRPHPHVDLRDSFGDDQSSEIDDFDEEDALAREKLVLENRIIEEEGRVMELRAAQTREKAANAQQIDASWRMKYSFQTTTPRATIRRQDTNIPLRGRHNLGLNPTAPRVPRSMWVLPAGSRGGHSGPQAGRY